MIECCFQGSIQPHPLWLVPLPKRQIPEHECKFLIHLFLAKITCSCETSECLEVVSNIQRKNFWPECSTHDLSTLISCRTFRPITTRTEAPAYSHGLRNEGNSSKEESKREIYRDGDELVSASGEER